MITSIIQNVSHMIVAAAAIYAVAGRTSPINPEKKQTQRLKQTWQLISPEKK